MVEDTNQTKVRTPQGRPSTKENLIELGPFRDEEGKPWVFHLTPEQFADLQRQIDGAEVELLKEAGCEITELKVSMGTSECPKCQGQENRRPCDYCGAPRNENGQNRD